MTTSGGAGSAVAWGYEEDVEVRGVLCERGHALFPRSRCRSRASEVPRGRRPERTQRPSSRRSRPPREPAQYPRRTRGSIFEAAGGRRAMRYLASGRAPEGLADPAVSPALSAGGADGHVERLAHYLAEALGGGDHYRRTYGEPAQVDRLHAGNGEHPEMDSAAIAAFDRAVRRAGIPQPAAGKIRRYWAWATRGPMAAHPESPDTVPADQGVHTWTWGDPHRAEG